MYMREETRESKREVERWTETKEGREVKEARSGRVRLGRCVGRVG